MISTRTPSRWPASFVVAAGVSLMAIVPSFSHAAVLTPAGTTYAPPTTGTLVLSEDYGSASGRDGQGSWTASASNITVNDQSITLAISASNGKTAALPLPFNLNDHAFTIDIGLKSWSTDDGQGLWSSQWTFTGSGHRYLATFQSKDGGIVKPENSSTPVVAAALTENAVHVIRLTGRDAATNTATFYVDANESTIADNRYNGGAKSILIDSGGDPASSTIELAWIRIYEDVEAKSHPVTPAPEPGSLALLGLGGLMMLSRKRR